MSDFSQGPGWWQASDGKWYPPESRPPSLPPQPTERLAEPITSPTVPSPIGSPAAKTGFFATHKGLKITGIVLAVLIVLGIISSLGKKKSPVATKPATSTTVTTRPAPTTTRPKATTVPPPTTAPGPKVSQQALRYVKAHTADATMVQSDVELVDTDIGLLLQNPDQVTQSDIDDLAQFGQEAHDSIDAIRLDFANGADGTGNNETWEAEVDAGANDLKNSMGALVAYTGNPNAATLASFSTQYNSAVGEWNDGVTNLWVAANIPNPPTIPTS
jgi:hypothetical protein